MTTRPMSARRSSLMSTCGQRNCIVCSSCSKQSLMLRRPSKAATASRSLSLNVYFPAWLSSASTSKGTM